MKYQADNTATDLHIRQTEDGRLKMAEVPSSALDLHIRQTEDGRLAMSFMIKGAGQVDRTLEAGQVMFHREDHQQLPGVVEFQAGELYPVNDDLVFRVVQGLRQQADQCCIECLETQAPTEQNKSTSLTALPRFLVEKEVLSQPAADALMQNIRDHALVAPRLHTPAAPASEFRVQR